VLWLLDITASYACEFCISFLYGFGLTVRQKGNKGQGLPISTQKMSQAVETTSLGGYYILSPLSFGYQPNTRNHYSCYHALCSQKQHPAKGQSPQRVEGPENLQVRVGAFVARLNLYSSPAPRSGQSKIHQFTVKCYGLRTQALKSRREGRRSVSEIRDQRGYRNY
jgi:hypothetical protein